MRTHLGRVLALALVVALAGCAPTPGSSETAASVEPSVAGVASASPSERAAAFPTAEVRGRPLADVLRDGVLTGDGLERLVFQPDEIPTEPMAMPGGESTAALEMGGGYLPSLAGVTAAGPAGAMASDSASLARWWSSSCGGEIVSEASLTEMTTFQDGYALGLSDDTEAFGTPAVGHGGIHVDFAAYAGCLIEDGSVVVVLTNREDLGTEVADALAVAARSG